MTMQVETRTKTAINLLPEEYRARERERRLTIMTAAGGLAVVGVLAAVLVSLFATKGALQRDLAAAANELAQLKSPLLAETTVEEMKADLRRKQAMLAAKSKRLAAAETLAAVSANLGKQLSVSSVAVNDKGEMLVQGTASGPAPIGRFRTALERSGAFSEIKLTIPSAAFQEGVSEEIKFFVRGKLVRKER